MIRNCTFLHKWLGFIFVTGVFWFFLSDQSFHLDLSAIFGISCGHWLMSLLRIFPNALGARDSLKNENLLKFFFFPTFCFSLQKQTLNLKIATILMNIPNYNHWCCFYEVSVTSGHWNMRSRYLTRKATDRPPIENYVLVIVARENRRSRSILI